MDKVYCFCYNKQRIWYVIFNQNVRRPKLKVLKDLQPTVDKINGLEGGFTRWLTRRWIIRQLSSKTGLRRRDGWWYSARGVRGCARGLIRAHRNASFWRKVAGGIVLHQGKISEMRPVKEKHWSRLASLSQRLAGQGIVVTVNDYLAKARQRCGWKIYISWD